MAELSFVEDTYNIRARLASSVIVFLPVMFAAASWWPGSVKWPGILAGAGVSLALGSLLSQLGRDLGKQKQSKLFEKWGGVPTTLLLSHRASTLNAHTIKRIHEALRALRPDLTIPRSQDEELENPASADAIYGSCTDALREISRDKAKYPLVFEENVGFGFRRNLWAMKPAAIVIAVLSALACLTKVWVDLSRTQAVEPISTSFAVVCIVLLVFWCVRITPSWVRVAGFAYAERLLGICETLLAVKPESKIIAP